MSTQSTQDWSIREQRLPVILPDSSCHRIKHTSSTSHCSRTPACTALRHPFLSPTMNYTRPCALRQLTSSQISKYLPFPQAVVTTAQSMLLVAAHSTGQPAHNCSARLQRKATHHAGSDKPHTLKILASAAVHEQPEALMATKVCPAV